MSVTKTKIDGWLTDAKKTYADAIAKGETPSNNYIHHLISPNLWLRITPKSGKAVFVYRVTIKNYVPEIAITKRKLKPSNVYTNWYTIGEYPHVSLADANHKGQISKVKINYLADHFLVA